MRENNSGRLLWKEYREGWPVILTYFLLPGIFFPICSRFQKSDVASAIVTTILFAMPFLTVLWGSEKKRTVKQNKDVLEAVLPVSPLQEWTCTFLIPALVIGLCGGWASMLFPRTISFDGNSYSFFAGFLIAAITYLISAFLSKYVSNLLAIMVGTIWISYSLFPSDILPTYVYFTTFIVIAISSLLAFEFRKMGQRSRKTFVLVISILFIISMNTHELSYIYGDILHATSGIKGIRVGRYFLNPFDTYSDYKNDISISRYTNLSGVDRIEYQNASHRKIHTLTTTMPSTSIPAAIDGQNRIYILTKRPFSQEIVIRRWDIKSGSNNVVCKLANVKRVNIKSRVWSFNEDSYISHIGSVDSAGTRMLLNLPSKLGIGTGCDLRIVDLSSGRNKLLLLNEDFAWGEITWFEDKVYLTGYQPAIEINTKDFTVRRIPSSRGSIQ